ncbi:hypothetical protein [Telmatospirillum sp.]|uniref:hypothetical protein n=1 Tax=Telmatospirillum sp. TaxID=2079197 RepID=UPI0028523F67|nr:hypothetical protein [Telmatospirillum sp.]MDR3435863.1 hypothetical protein [Telmatospirillum sp.]
MNCPFCDEEIKDSALVCKHCGRDLSVLRPVLDRFTAIEARLASVETALQTLSGHVDDVRSKETVPPRPARRLTADVALLAPALLLIALLLAAHWVIIATFDLNTWVLRLVSILLPLPFGLLGPRSVTATVAMAVTVAVTAVWGMLAITGTIDHVPVLPDNLHDWIETTEYAVSIALAFATGHLLRGLWRSRRSSNDSKDSLVYEIATLLAKSSAPKNETRVHAKLRAENIASWLNYLALIVTAACSIATGIGKFFPGLGKFLP